MIELIQSVGANRLYRSASSEYILYSGNPSVDLNTIRSILSKNKVKAVVDVDHEMKFHGEIVRSTKISHGRDVLYILNDEVKINFTGMSEFIRGIKLFGTHNVVMENNRIQISPLLSYIDKYTFATRTGEKVSAGNFMVHFGDFMDGNRLESFFRILYTKENALLDSLLKSYAPIIKKSNFQNIIGYAHVNKLYKNVLHDNIISNYSPLSECKYCILLNDSPIVFKFDRIEGNNVIIKVELSGEFRYRGDLPNFDPYIILTPKKMSALPSILHNVPIFIGNKKSNVGVYVSILKFSKPEIFKDSKFSIDLLSSGK